MKSYTLRKLTLIAPSVTNAGDASGYPDRVADSLDYHRIGYTQRAEHMGSWHGKREPGVTFEILIGDTSYIETIGAIARGIMIDQDAIQLVDEGEVTCWEA